MTDHPAVVARPARRRPRRGWVPNQHGAWAMLAAPLLVGVVAGGPAWVQIPLTLFWFVGYFAFFATSQWLKSGRKAAWFPPVRTYVPIATLLGAVVALLRPDLLVWAPAFILPLGAGLAAAAARRERELLAGLATVVAAGLITVVAYDAGNDGDLGRAWRLAAVQFLYFAGTVFYVKSAIRERANRRFAALSAGFHAVATIGVAMFSWQLAVVFVLLTVRAIIVPSRGLSPKALGVGEIVATVIVAAVSLLTV